MSEAEIVIRYSSNRVARSVKDALTPDDKLGTQRMKISTSVGGRTLKVHLERCERIETLQATLQDIFRCIHASESSLARLTSSN